VILLGKLKPLHPRDVIKILEKNGFRYVSTGRHAKYRNDEGKSVPVPASHDYVSLGVILSLIRQTGIPREEFER